VDRPCPWRSLHARRVRARLLGCLLLDRPLELPRPAVRRGRDPVRPRQRDVSGRPLYTIDRELG
jgi:hypothetical protein